MRWARSSYQSLKVALRSDLMGVPLPHLRDGRGCLMIVRRLNASRGDPRRSEGDRYFETDHVQLLMACSSTKEDTYAHSRACSAHGPVPRHRSRAPRLLYAQAKKD